MFVGFSNKDNATFVWRANLFIYFNEWWHCRFAQWFHRSQLGCNKVFYLKKSNLMMKARKKFLKCIEVKDLMLSTRLPFNFQGIIRVALCWLSELIWVFISGDFVVMLQGIFVLGVFYLFLLVKWVQPLGFMKQKSFNFNNLMYPKPNELMCEFENY